MTILNKIQNAVTGLLEFKTKPISETKVSVTVVVSPDELNGLEEALNEEYEGTVRFYWLDITHRKCQFSLNYIDFTLVVDRHIKD